MTRTRLPCNSSIGTSLKSTRFQTDKPRLGFACFGDPVLNMRTRRWGMSDAYRIAAAATIADTIGGRGQGHSDRPNSLFTSRSSYNYNGLENDVDFCIVCCSINR